jgi:exosome complex component MTR3
MIGLVMSCSAVSVLSWHVVHSHVRHVKKAVIGQEIWLDPTEAESTASEGSLVLACLPALGAVSSVWQTGAMKVPEVLQVVIRRFRIPDQRVDIFAPV